MVYNFEVQDYHTYFVGSTIWVHNSCGNFAKGATQGTKSNYRKLFLNKFPDLPKGWQVHHTLPQKYADIIKKMGINVHEVKYLKGVDPDVHKLITKEWRNWDKGKIDVSEYYAIKVAIEKPSYDDPQIGYAIPGKKLFDWLSRNAGPLLLYTAGTAVEVAGWVADLGTITLLFGSVPSGGSSLALAPVTVFISSTAKVTGAAMMGTALYMMRQNSGGGKKKPIQKHHFASNKSKTYTKEFKKIADKYKLDLDDPWNKELMPHQGRHPNAYHEYVLDQMKRFDSIADGDVNKFLKIFDQMKQEIIKNPEMLYKNYWK